VADEVLEGEQESQPQTEKPRGRGLFRVIKVVAFVSVIVVVEIVVAKMIVPTAQETERLAHDLAAASAGHEAEGQEEHAEEGDHGSSHDLREVELGTYNVTRYNPATNTTLAIDFELYGTVLADDVTEFEHQFENSKARIREQVTMTLHGAESSSLTDAGLGLIKRQILEKTNRALGEPILKEVLFSKFNFVER
jgi:flagellar basal body-associated protein FliL